MPRLPIDYSKTIIYKIVCNDLNICDLYVGSTTDFTRRKREHKSKSNNEKSKSYNVKLYQMIRQNGGWSNWSMVEIEKFSCNDSNEAHARERHHYELLNCNMNTNIPNRNTREYHKQYYENNKEKRIEQNKQYRINNKQKISECKKQYCENNKEKIKEYYKQYCENNKEKIKQYNKKYRESKKQNQQNENIVL